MNVVVTRLGERGRRCVVVEGVNVVYCVAQGENQRLAFACDEEELAQLHEKLGRALQPRRLGPSEYKEG